MNKIKKIREQNGMSQTELSNQSGVPVGTIRDWEQNRRNLNIIYQMQKIAKVLGCTIEDLINFEE